MKTVCHSQVHTRASGSLATGLDGLAASTAAFGFEEWTPCGTAGVLGRGAAAMGREKTAEGSAMV